MKQLPKDAQAYKKTPVFSELTSPKGLLKNHSTKNGVWGKIVVTKGRLEYTIIEPSLEVTVLHSKRFGVVEPKMLHRVKPLGAVLFYVEFYQ